MPAAGCGWRAPCAQIVPRDNREKALLLDRASTAAYIAYQRAKRPQRRSRQPGAARPDAGRPPALAAGARRHAAVARTCARPPNCAASTSACGSRTASGCSTIRSIPTPYRRAPASSSRKRCPAGAPISRPSWRSTGIDKPAISVNDRQLCVDGLKHGERYRITLRAGLPSTVHETLAKSANSPSSCATASRSCASPARPMCCRAPASAAFRCSASTPARSSSTSTASATATWSTRCSATISSAISAAIRRSSIADERGSKVWSGELAVQRKLNTEVTTAFPVDKALGTLKPGVYVMTATPKELLAQRLRRARHAMVHRFRSRPHRL